MNMKILPNTVHSTVYLPQMDPYFGSKLDFKLVLFPIKFLLEL